MDIKILYDLSDLRDTGFGQPPPRHGLNLLWWFAHKCVRIDSNGRIVAKCNPTNGDFGFDRFYNRERLLPDTVLKYYKVGNLNTTDSLPNYVTEYYTGQSENRNTDRIVVSFDLSLNKFEKIYVTRHSDRTNFDQNHTYRISIGLLKKIRELKQKDFLKKTTNHPSKDKHQSVETNSCQSTSNEHLQDNREFSDESFLTEPSDYSIDMPPSVQDNQTNTCQRKNCCYALIGCSLLIILLLIIAAIVHSVLK